MRIMHGSLQRARLAPHVLATMASQALLVVSITSTRPSPILAVHRTATREAVDELT
jgi:hypothetical protein